MLRDADIVQFVVVFLSAATAKARATDAAHGKLHQGTRYFRVLRMVMRAALHGKIDVSRSFHAVTNAVDQQCMYAATATTTNNNKLDK